MLTYHLPVDTIVWFLPAATSFTFSGFRTIEENVISVFDKNSAFNKLLLQITHTTTLLSNAVT